MITLHQAHDRLLRGVTHHSASQWAEYVSRNVPDIDLLFDGEPPSVLAQEHFSGLRRAGDIVRFDIFSSDGRLRLRSESLSGLDAHEIGSTDGLAAAVAASGMARSGMLQRVGAGTPGPRGFAYVPVRLSGQIAGVARVEVDHKVVAALVRRAFATVALSIGALMSLLFLAAWVARRRHRRQQVMVDERVRFLAHHDPLTGACNRASFQDALTGACSRLGADSRGALAVLCIDLDHFKEVNDRHGHAAGDAVLRQVTQRLSSLVRSGDIVARLGGDEFAILQTGVTRPDDVEALASRVTNALAEPYDVSGYRLGGGASVGAAVHGVDGFAAETLMNRADAALYAAKAKGRNAYAFFDPALDGKRERQRRLTQDLRTALEQGGLSMDFQPVFDVDGQTMLGYEALARWRHPVLGLISPVEFVPLAEANGLIVPLGNWALGEACQAAAGWPCGLSVAVNFSAAQFRHGEAMLTHLRDVLHRTGLAPERLEIEITESVLMVDTDNALMCLNGMHDLGVRVALDDFGTGFSSLAYLWRFPFDKVKIDRSFTHLLGADEKVSLIVKSIVSLAHELRIRVNAEGIETQQQMAMLAAYGCDELQGFLLGRPGAVDLPGLAGRRMTRAATAARSNFTPLDPQPVSL